MILSLEDIVDFVYYKVMHSEIYKSKKTIFFGGGL